MVTALSRLGSVGPWPGWLKSAHGTDFNMSCLSVTDLGNSQRLYMVTSRQCSALSSSD